MSRKKRSAARQPVELEKTLVSWVVLNSEVMRLSEEDLERLLNLERRGKHRRSFMIRIQQRLNRIRILDALKTIRNDIPVQQPGRRST